MMKRIGFTALALTLATSLTPAALAEDLLIAPAPTAGAFTASIAVNGVKLDTSPLPAAAPSLIPMRLVAEADYGSAGWFQEESRGYFSLDNHRIYVSFTDGSVTVDNAALEGVTATVTDGVTFLPASVIADLSGYGVTLNDAAGSEEIAITTPNGAPLVKLAREIIETTEMASFQKNTDAELKDFLDIDPARYTELVSFSSMIIRADNVVIGKLAEGADRAAAKAELEAHRASIQQSFEQYLPDPLAMAKAGRVVEHEDYLMLIISPDVDKAVELFEAAVSSPEQ